MVYEKLLFVKSILCWILFIIYNVECNYYYMMYNNFWYIYKGGEIWMMFELYIYVFYKL